jgi:hypothetical protein
VIRTFGQPKHDAILRRYRAEVPGLKEKYEAARQLNRIPVTLPGGDALALSPGGQNILIKQMIKDFCAYFTPGGEALYLGDADTPKCGARMIQRISSTSMGAIPRTIWAEH